MDNGEKPTRTLELIRNVFGYFAIWLVLFVVTSFTSDMDHADCYIISLLWAWPMYYILIKG